MESSSARYRHNGTSSIPQSACDCGEFVPPAEPAREPMFPAEPGRQNPRSSHERILPGVRPAPSTDYPGPKDASDSPERRSSARIRAASAVGSEGELLVRLVLG